MNKHIVRGLVAAGVLTAAGAANAAVDTTVISGAIPDIAAVGTAVLAVVVAIMLTKWVRRAL